MKRIMKSFVSLLLVICILSSLNITVTAENMNDQGNSSFAYDNVTLYVADCIMNGIIGKNGKLLKEIGTEARKDIEALLGEPIYLTLWVKVKDDWRKKKPFLKELGYVDEK